MAGKKACCNPACPHSKFAGELLEETSFYRAAKNGDGLDKYCKGCRTDKNLECRQKNPDRVASWNWGSRSRRPESVDRRAGKRFYPWQKADNAAMRTRKVDRRHRIRTEEERRALSDSLKGNTNAAGNAGNGGRKMSDATRNKQSIARAEYWRKKKGISDTGAKRPRRGTPVRKVAPPRVFDYKTGTWANKPIK